MGGSIDKELDKLINKWITEFNNPNVVENEKKHLLKIAYMTTSRPNRTIVDLEAMYCYDPPKFRKKWAWGFVGFYENGMKPTE